MSDDILTFTTPSDRWLSRESKKLTFGVGVKDNKHPLVRKEYDKVEGKWIKVWCCPYYLKWKDMLMRCYSVKYKSKNPSYEDCKVCDEWLIFSNFKSWMEGQDWVGKALDKDIIFYGNKMYSPETCVFVDAKLNMFMSNNRKGMIGVNYHKRDKVFVANVSNPYTGRVEYLGNFKNEINAHNAWKERKLELLKMLCNDLNVDAYLYEICVKNLSNRVLWC